MKLWLIEHPAQGVYVGHDDFGEKPEWRPRFRWSIPRTEGQLFYSEGAAKDKLSTFPPRLRSRCRVAVIEG